METGQTTGEAGAFAQDIKMAHAKKRLEVQRAPGTNRSAINVRDACSQDTERTTLANAAALGQLPTMEKDAKAKEKARAKASTD